MLFRSARRIVVNDAWQNVLTHTALTDDQHTKVNGRHLEGDVQRVVQRLAVAYDAVTLLNVLKFGSLHSTVFYAIGCKGTKKI